MASLTTSRERGGLARTEGLRVPSHQFSQDASTLDQTPSGTLTSTTATATTTTASPFAELGARPHTVRALARMDIETPTLIQTRAIPPLLAGRDVIGQSRTGSGKTIAFGLPLVERIDPRRRQVQALVLVPTRELASQVADVLAALDGRRGLRVVQLIGGRPRCPPRAGTVGRPPASRPARRRGPAPTHPPQDCAH